MSDTSDTTVIPPLQAETPDARRRVRVGTIVWGAILLAAVALFVATRIPEFIEVDGWTALAWGGIGIGAILIVGGVAAAATRRG